MLRAAGLKVETFASAAGFLARPERDVPGCVLLDLQMPGLSGLDVQEALAQAGQTLPVVFLTGHGDIPTTVQAMRRGAEDFLTKLAPRAQLLHAVRRALARDASVRAERDRLAALRVRFAALTPRELEVLLTRLAGKAEQADRRRPQHQRADGEAPPHGHPHQAWRTLRGRAGEAVDRGRARQWSATGHR